MKVVIAICVLALLVEASVSQESSSGEEHAPHHPHEGGHSHEGHGSGHGHQGGSSGGHHQGGSSGHGHHQGGSSGHGHQGDGSSEGGHQNHQPPQHPPSRQHHRNAFAALNCMDDIDLLCTDQRKSMSDNGILPVVACLHQSKQELSRVCSDAIEAMPEFICSEEAQRLCGDKDEADIPKCMFENRDDVAGECKELMSRMLHMHGHEGRRRGRGNQGNEEEGEDDERHHGHGHGPGHHVLAMVLLVAAVALVTGLVVKCVRRRRARRARRVEEGVLPASAREVQMESGFPPVNAQPVLYAHAEPSQPPRQPSRSIQTQGPVEVGYGAPLLRTEGYTSVSDQ